jgi:uncharacterized protein (DUF3084 family)
MEIHAPHKPILTVKEAAVHLAIVTAGILIALSLEGLREWREHRSLVNEARANLLSEIRDNRKEVAAAVGALEQVKTDLANASEVAQQVAEEKNSTRVRSVSTTSSRCPARPAEPLRR